MLLCTHEIIFGGVGGSSKGRQMLLPGVGRKDEGSKIYLV